MTASERLTQCKSAADRTDLVLDFHITAKAHVHLLPRRARVGTCGVLRERVYVFAYDAKGDTGESGSFLADEECARHLFDLTGQAPLPCFDPFTSVGSSLPVESVEREPLNGELFSVLNLLILFWDPKPDYHFLKHLDFFNLYPDKRPFDERVRKINHLVASGEGGSSLRQMIAAESSLRAFEFPEISAVLLKLGIANHIDP
jgi:hypothetical protein